MRAPDETQPVVDFYTGVAPEFDECVIARNKIESHFKAARIARDTRNTVALKLAMEEIHTAASQMAIMSGHIVKVAAHNLNRRART